MIFKFRNVFTKLLLTIMLQLMFPTVGFMVGFFDSLDSIRLVYNPDNLRIAGEHFEIGVIGYFENGKVKKTVNLENGTMLWSRFKVEVIGGTQRGGRIYISSKLMQSKGKYIKIKVYPNKKPHLFKQLLLPLNYEKDIQLVPVSKLVKAPGFGFDFKIVSTFDNGKIREYVYGKNYNFNQLFRLAVDGGNFKRNQFVIDPSIQNITDHEILIEILSQRNPKLSSTFKLTLDYVADYQLYLSGSSGTRGSNGFSGSSGSRGCDGADGQHGQDGYNGDNGPDIGVWVDLYFDSILFKNLVYVYTENLWSGYSWSYLINPDGGTIHVVSSGGSGGSGGNGGSGGSGGKGEDGATHSKEVALTDSTSKIVYWQDEGDDGGDGGNGGNGGNGGIGGNGGNIYLYFTEDAQRYSNLIIAKSIGGYSGSGGWGGSSGSGGSGGNGDPSGSSGHNGSSGSTGNSGWSGHGGRVFYDSTDDFVTYNLPVKDD